MTSSTFTAPLRQSGSFFALCLDTIVQLFRSLINRRFQWREAIEQAWFLASVTILPTALVSIPFGAVIALQIGNLSRQV
ncbi:MAG TPA: hypothetical protein VGK66_02055, partial [Solirubrobacterales bacterium]